jgi:dCTP deaminase
LVIATATGVHPGFTGCLTPELANLGDIPIAIQPGMTIGQLFLHSVVADEGDTSVDQSAFTCKRAPRLGHPQSDAVARKLARASLFS